MRTARTAFAVAAVVAATVMLAGCTHSDDPQTEPTGSSVVVPGSPVDPDQQTPRATTAPSSAEPSETATTRPPVGYADDRYRVSTPGQTMPDPPVSADGTFRYHGEQWPVDGVDTWQATTSAFVAAAADPDSDLDAWLAGLRPYVTDRLLDRLARDDARPEIASWGTPKVAGVELLDGDVGVQVAQVDAGSSRWSQVVTLWFFDDGTWRVDTCGLSWN